MTNTILILSSISRTIITILFINLNTSQHKLQEENI